MPHLSGPELDPNFLSMRLQAPYTIYHVNLHEHCDKSHASFEQPKDVCYAALSDRGKLATIASIWATSVILFYLPLSAPNHASPMPPYRQYIKHKL